MEIMYRVQDIKKLKKVNCLEVRWLKIPEDFNLFKDHLLDQGFDLSISDWKDWHVKGNDYCGLIIDGKMVARAAVERYSETKWETADVRVLPHMRGKGYGKQVVYFITKYILDSGKIATCRTNNDNKRMQHLALSIGFERIEL